VCTVRFTRRFDFTYGSISLAALHGLLRFCTIAHTIIHGHDIRARFMKFYKSYTAFTDTLNWLDCNSDQATVSSVVCTVYTGGQSCKPFVLCEIGFTESIRTNCKFKVK